MTREEATKIVDQYVLPFGQFRGVIKCRVRKLLGEKKFRLLEADPIRNLGPTKHSVYPWNVVDYLVVDIKEE